MTTNQVEARANIDALIPQYRSGAEQVFARMGPILLADEFGSNVALMEYERMRFRVPGGWYTPDFSVILDDRRLIFVEVKGSTHQKGYRDARSKLRAVADLYPWVTWIEAIPDRGGGWSLERIKPEGWID